MCPFQKPFLEKVTKTKKKTIKKNTKNCQKVQQKGPLKNTKILKTTIQSYHKQVFW